MDSSRPPKAGGKDHGVRTAAARRRQSPPGAPLGCRRAEPGEPDRGVPGEEPRAADLRPGAWEGGDGAGQSPFLKGRRDAGVAGLQGARQGGLLDGGGAPGPPENVGFSPKCHCYFCLSTEQVEGSRTKKHESGISWRWLGLGNGDECTDDQCILELDSLGREMGSLREGGTKNDPHPPGFWVAPWGEELPPLKGRGDSSKGSLRPLNLRHL